MTNIEKIMFDAKYNVEYKEAEETKEGMFILSGFNYSKSMHVKNELFYDFLNDTDFAYFNEEEWKEFVESYTVNL